MSAISSLPIGGGGNNYFSSESWYTSKGASPLSGFGQSAVYIPLVGQIVQDTVVSKRRQFGVDGSLSLCPAALLTFFLRLLLFIIHLTLRITAFIALKLWRKIRAGERFRYPTPHNLLV